MKKMNKRYCPICKKEVETYLELYDELNREHCIECDCEIRNGKEEK